MSDIQISKSDKFGTVRTVEINGTPYFVGKTVISHSDGHTRIRRTPKCTGKGQIYFVNKFMYRGAYNDT